MKTSSLVLLLTLSIASTGSAAPREEWYRGLDLEEAVGASDLILVAQVAKVSEVTITRGGKGESAMFQFAFKPLRSLKGLFARPELSLTSSDIGGWRFGEDVTRIREGEIRLLLLHREQRRMQ